MTEKIHLKEGEIICDNCHGNTVVPMHPGGVSICTKCWGSGKLDWVEVCTGKAMPKHIFSIPTIRTMYSKSILKELGSIQPITWDMQIS